MERYLASTQHIDWKRPQVRQLAFELNSGLGDDAAIARRCFEWVRDNIRHSIDYQLEPLTCRASEVLEHGSGYCYAKSHLLAALLRANGIPAGFCYQRLSIDGAGAPYSLHGFNAAHLKAHGWYRFDARGNRTDIDAQFRPPREQLAFGLNDPHERDFPEIWAEPLPLVVRALQSRCSAPELLNGLPDVAVGTPHASPVPATPHPIDL